MKAKYRGMIEFSLKNNFVVFPFYEKTLIPFFVLSFQFLRTNLNAVVVIFDFVV